MKKMYLSPEVNIEEMCADWNIVTMSGGDAGNFDELETGDL